MELIGKSHFYRLQRAPKGITDLHRKGPAPKGPAQAGFLRKDNTVDSELYTKISITLDRACIQNAHKIISVDFQQ